MSKRIIIDYTNKIEDQPESTIVNFANSFIGGGSLNRGSAQEEILFLMYPELFVSPLFCERMCFNESIFIHNVRRFADSDGYTDTLQFKGPY